MPFSQFNLDKSVEQTRNIFDKFVYKTDDAISDVVMPGYFEKARFAGQEGWEGGIIEVRASDGFAVLSIEENNQVSINYSTSFAGVGFLATSDDTITVSLDPNAPSFLTGFNFDGSDEFELFDAATGAVKNVSGRTLTVLGTISYNPNKIGGGVALLQTLSESSFDEGSSYSVNVGSLRPVEINNSGESFKTIVSFLAAWAPNQIVRFRVFEDSNTATNIEPSSTSALGGTVTGHSVIWTLGGL